MRRVLGWIALAIGVAIVAAMAWYGALALFGDEEIKIGTDQDVEIVAD